MKHNYEFAFGRNQLAHELSEHIITMPLHMWLTNNDVKRIIEIVNGFVR